MSFCRFLNYCRNKDGGKKSHHFRGEKIKRVLLMILCENIQYRRLPEAWRGVVMKQLQWNSFVPEIKGILRGCKNTFWKTGNMFNMYMHFTFMWPCIVTYFFVIKPTRCTNFTNLFCHETLHVSDSSSVHHQEFIHCTLSNGICHTGL